MSAVIVQDPGSGSVVGFSNQGKIGQQVQLSNQDDTGINGWIWEIVDRPSGSTAVLSDPNAANPTYTPDVAGTYLINLKTYTDAGHTTLDAENQTATGVPLAGIFNVSWRIPAATERTEANATRGWAGSEMNAILKETARHLYMGHFDSVIGNGDSPYSPVSYETVLVDTTGGAVTVNLPAIGASNKGHRITIKDVGQASDTITVVRTGSDTIEGATSLVLAGTSKEGEYAVLESDGTSTWHRIGGFSVTVGGSLTAPLDPGDDGKPAVASGGDLTYTLLGNAHIAAAAGIVVTKIAPGAANQIVKTNSGGTALEHGLIQTANIANSAVTASKIANDMTLAEVLDRGNDANTDPITNLGGLSLTSGTINQIGSEIQIQKDSATRFGTGAANTFMRAGPGGSGTAGFTNAAGAFKVRYDESSDNLELASGVAINWALGEVSIEKSGSQRLYTSGSSVSLNAGSGGSVFLRVDGSKIVNAFNDSGGSGFYGLDFASIGGASLFVGASAAPTTDTPGVDLILGASPGGTGGAGDNDGGNLILAGGLKSGSGADGAVLIQDPNSNNLIEASSNSIVHSAPFHRFNDAAGNQKAFIGSALFQLDVSPFRFDVTVSSPEITQEDAGDVAGQDLLVSAQSNDSVGNKAGSLLLESGFNDNSGGESGDVGIRVSSSFAGAGEEGYLSMLEPGEDESKKLRWNEYTVAFNEVQPTASMIRSYTLEGGNWNADRSFDADNTTLDEIADVLSTLIVDLGGAPGSQTTGGYGLFITDPSA